jgi:hypothetical protein
MRFAESLASVLLGVATVTLILWPVFMPSGFEENRFAKRPAQATRPPIPTARGHKRQGYLSKPILFPVQRPRTGPLAGKGRSRSARGVAKKDENIVER